MTNIFIKCKSFGCQNPPINKRKICRACDYSKNKPCIVSGCPFYRQSERKPLCSTHEAEKSKYTCKEPGCKKYASAEDSFCRTHLKGKICRSEGCEGEIFILKHMLCLSCYQKMRNAGGGAKKTR